MFRKRVLDNGITVLTERMPSVRSVAMGVWLKRGSRHETNQEGGLAHFIEHMVFKGTERRSQAQIAEELDSIGGQSDAFTTQEYAGFHVKVLDEHVPRAVDLLSDILQRPRFDVEELERERMVIVEEIKSVEDSPEELVHDLFCESFWPDHPLGRPILGSKETVSGFGRDDLLNFFRRTYVPDNLIVAAAGNLDHEAVATILTDAFGSLPGRADTLVEEPPHEVPRIMLHDKDLEQAHLLVGTVAPAEASADRYTAYVLNAVLGGNLSARLFQVIREERGLAYSVYSGLGSFRDAGQFTIYAGTDSKNVPEVLDLVLQELRRIRQEPVPNAELQRAKDHLRGSILMGLESTGARMSQLARYELYFGRQIPIEETLGALDKVGAEEVLHLAGQMFHGKPLAMTLLGKLEHLHPMPETLVA